MEFAKKLIGYFSEVFRIQRIYILIIIIIVFNVVKNRKLTFKRNHSFGGT